MDLRLLKSFIVVLLSFILLATTSIQPAHAVDKSRVFIWLVFTSGLGSSAAGVILRGQANETYDEYLHTAVQADMDELIDDYDRKNQQSIIASRTGIGLVIGAMLLSLIDAAYIPPPEETPRLFGDGSISPGDVRFSAHTQDGEFLLSIGQTF